MAATDLVPCYYTGQRVGIEPPAESKPRYELREAKRQKLGEFVRNGKFFLFFKRMAAKIVRLSDGDLGVGNALPFSRQSDGSRLHYEIPRAGDIGLWRHFRKRIQVSARSRFSHQSLDFSGTHNSALALADALR